MLGEEKNLKDPERKPTASYGAGSKEMSVITYTKTNKLITALYIVTDIMDTEEPLRLKLRTLGVETLSDIISSQRVGLVKKIQSILSLLDIAFTMNMITEMNKNILAGEFLKFKNSLITPQDNPAWLEEFLRERAGDELPPEDGLGLNAHIRQTRIGIQKGSTLLKAIKDMSDRMPVRKSKNNLTPYEAGGFRSGFNILKKQRQDNIISIIKTNGGSATIKDIRTSDKFSTVGEKTLQRELVSMVKNGVLKKSGEKRWSRYFII